MDDRPPRRDGTGRRQSLIGVVELLIEAGRADIIAVFDADPAGLIVDHRTVPLVRSERSATW